MPRERNVGKQLAAWCGQRVRAVVLGATAAVLAYRAIALLVPVVLGSVAFALLRRSLAREAFAISECEPGGQVEVIGRGTVRLTA